jgi:hypothetical protein
MTLWWRRNKIRDCTAEAVVTRRFGILSSVAFFRLVI